MLQLRARIFGFNIGYRMRPALIPDQQGVTLRKVTGILRPRHNFHAAAIGLVGISCGNPLGDNTAAGVLAHMDHLGTGIGLLPVIRDRDRIKFPLGIIPFQNTARIFPRNGRSGFHLRPADF